MVRGAALVISPWSVPGLEAGQPAKSNSNDTAECEVKWAILACVVGGGLGIFYWCTGIVEINTLVRVAPQIPPPQSSTPTVKSSTDIQLELSK